MSSNNPALPLPLLLSPPVPLLLLLLLLLRLMRYTSPKRPHKEGGNPALTSCRTCSLSRSPPLLDRSPTDAAAAAAAALSAVVDADRGAKDKDGNCPCP